MTEHTDSVLIPFQATAGYLALLYNESIQKLADIYYEENISPWLKEIGGRLSNSMGMCSIVIDNIHHIEEKDSIFLTDKGYIAYHILNQEVLGTSSPLGCFMKEG